MEEHNKNIVSLVLHGCKLAKEVELNLGDHQRNELANHCDEIAMIFSQAKEWLRRGTTTTTTTSDDQDHYNNNINVEILGSSSSSAIYSQRPRKRKDDKEIRIVKMAAPQIGNTEIPPEDNYTWRKYGQKEIMGSKYPRCTHQKLYQCPAKKQVQRMDDDPLMFEVMYRDLADVMFGSSSSNSMDFLFPTTSIEEDHNNKLLQPDDSENHKN
ncbi:hypothetical protein G4B88_014206 [Cannabis sativa]|uniref:WRKY domain-containing protein n=1 Tax=Cannabis sativa TaxID=3483 RepID=A0A7J6EYY4_CANSA|nr:hypothetical protein G4B88_014206 [Cannabis sativa]